MGKRREAVLGLFRPKGGRSRWVTVREIRATPGLTWERNGHGRHGKYFGMEDYLWEVRREGSSTRGSISKLRMVGYAPTAFRQHVDKRVREELNGLRAVCNLSLVPLSRADRELDHRYGFKAHPDYIAIYQPGTQSSASFQWLHRSLNQKKREMCKQCVASKQRPPHPLLGFVEGSNRLEEHLPCRGCYLAEPEKYRSWPRLERVGFEANKEKR